MIVTEKLSKTYGRVVAVAGLDLEVRPGEIFGFLGPNGAGKTTTIRMLTTLTRPTSGRARLNGFDVVTQALAAKREFGVVQQHLSLDRELTVRENLELAARLRHLGRKGRQRRIQEMLVYVELQEVASRLVEELSGGMKRRVMMARALLHRPRVLFLDEPTVGLDVQTRRRIWDLIRRLNTEGTTVFLTTHYIEEAETLCHRVGIMHQGEMIALGTPRQLRERVGLYTVEALWNGRDTRYTYFPDRSRAAAYSQSLPAEVKTVVVRESNLEDVFVELTGHRVEEDMNNGFSHRPLA